MIVYVARDRVDGADIKVYSHRPEFDGDKYFAIDDIVLLFKMSLEDFEYLYGYTPDLGRVQLKRLNMSNV